MIPAQPCALATWQRTCTKDYKIPDSGFVIPKGLMVNLMPEMDKCFANPDNFDPSNFEEENQFNKIGFVSFGQGPRNCIGKLLQRELMKQVFNLDLLQE